MELQHYINIYLNVTSIFKIGHTIPKVLS